MQIEKRNVYEAQRSKTIIRALCCFVDFCVTIYFFGEGGRGEGRATYSVRFHQYSFH